MTPEAILHLQKVDPVLRRVIRQVGGCTLEPDGRRTPFESLVRAVANQQLNGRAAETILNRFIALFPRRRFPRAEEVPALSDAQMRACGFSRAKIAAIRDIAAKAETGWIPTSAQIRRMTDEAIVERLVEVRGVGRWTVEMLLIFKLGRPDVLPADDFGVRNGFRLAYGLAEMPTPREVREHGACWAPHRTTAAWYLWRMVDTAKENAAKK
ncbi:MAG: DNA-3-methyladenine glycosylase 2 family protein [Verrucomicrobiales bacterium]|nr:DNA-3-methyladenine glycosylase 2 family protein [Verrucomicrobiales bacterium]